MKLPVFELKINEALDDNSEVEYIALVEEPAIMKDFLAFKDEFVSPNKGEHKEEFLQRCIKYVIDEGKDADQAVAICNNMWTEHFAGEKISFDYDDTLNTAKGKELAAKKISEGFDVYVISARNDKAAMLELTKSLGIADSKVFATGSNEAKIAKIKELNISKHYDNNPDVISQLNGIGQKFIEQMKFQIVSEDKHIISGPIMIADELIYRKPNAKILTEHYVKFSAETIKDIAIKFAKKKYQENVNLMHDPNQKVDGVVMFESFLVDKSRGIKPMAGFEDVPDGSWFGSFYVENAEVWASIKDGTYKGFSVEGLFDYGDALKYEDEMLQRIKNILFS